MSKDWSLYCRNCKESAGYLNHGTRQLQAIYEVREHLVKCSNVLNYSGALDCVSHYSSELLSFLHRHWLHDLCLKSEYGDEEPFKELDPILPTPALELRQLVDANGLISDIREIDAPRIHWSIVYKDKSRRFEYKKTVHALLHVYEEGTESGKL